MYYKRVGSNIKCKRGTNSLFKWNNKNKHYMNYIIWNLDINFYNTFLIKPCQDVVIIGENPIVILYIVKLFFYF